MHFITPRTLLKMTRIVTVRSLLVKGKNFQFKCNFQESADERGIFSVNKSLSSPPPLLPAGGCLSFCLEELPDRYCTYFSFTVTFSARVT